MKKISILVLMLCLLAALIVLPADAAPMTENVGDVTVYKGTPTIDGDITEEEYAGAQKVVINHTNMKALENVFVNSQVPESLTITAYQLWDEKGIYFAFDVADKTPAPGKINADGNWMLNADNIQIFMDPGPTLAYKELVDTDLRAGRRSPLYNVGVNEDGTVYVLRQLVTNEMIANLAEVVDGAGKSLETGWTFEVCIPWEVLLTDINEKVTETELTMESFTEGLSIPTMFIYNDVVAREDGNLHVGMYETSLDGYSAPFDWQPEIFGINLVLSGIAHEEAPEPTEPEPTVPPTEDLGTQVTVPDSTEKPGDNNEPADGDFPLVPVIIAAVVLIAVIVVVIVVVRKKKSK